MIVEQRLPRVGRDAVTDERRAAARALSLVQMGELSEGAEVAFGNDPTRVGDEVLVEILEHMPDVH